VKWPALLTPGPVQWAEPKFNHLVPYFRVYDINCELSSMVESREISPGKPSGRAYEGERERER
jgi:hypothetical protein